MSILSPRLRGALYHISAAVTLLTIAAATPASAAIIETSTITNSYRYQIGTEIGSSTDAGPTAFISANNTNPGNGNISEGAIQLTSYLDGAGNFYFLHNSFCHGGCDILMTTEIVFTIQNTGPDAVNLRFDTQITPGHVARNNSTGTGDSGGLFTFTVDQDPGTANNRLFEASGFTGLGTGVNTSDDSVFNGFNTQSASDPNFAVSDWSATDLNLQLSTLAAGATTTVRYRSTLQVLNNADCRDGLVSSICAGFQVAFGDPRNNGSVDGLTAFGSTADAGNGALPAVGAIYDPYRISAHFVPVGSPLPGAPAVIRPIPYNTGYVPFADADSAVPEPASWAMMIAGFGLIGGRLRARQPGSRRNRVYRPAWTPSADR